MKFYFDITDIINLMKLNQQRMLALGTTKAIQNYRKCQHFLHYQTKPLGKKRDKKNVKTSVGH